MPFTRATVAPDARRPATAPPVWPEPPSIAARAARGRVTSSWGPIVRPCSPCAWERSDHRQRHQAPPQRLGLLAVRPEGDHQPGGPQALVVAAQAAVAAGDPPRLL